MLNCCGWGRRSNPERQKHQGGWGCGDGVMWRKMKLERESLRDHAEPQVAFRSSALTLIVVGSHWGWG